MEKLLFFEISSKIINQNNSEYFYSFFPENEAMI